VNTTVLCVVHTSTIKCPNCIVHQFSVLSVDKRTSQTQNGILTHNRTYLLIRFDPGQGPNGQLGKNLLYWLYCVHEEGEYG